MKLLDKFCSKLYKFQPIFHSEEMKIFFSNSTDIKKSLSGLSTENYEDLLLKYKNSFLDYYEVLFF
jgi:hypothetical protein